jgi:hypothetical protein
MNTTSVPIEYKAGSNENSRTGFFSTGDLSSDSAKRAIPATASCRLRTSMRTSTVPPRYASLKPSTPLIRSTTANIKMTGIEASTFKQLHKLVFTTIEEWTQHPTATNLNFYQVWSTKWKDKIKPGQTFSGVKKTLQIGSLSEYYDLVSQCPLVIQNLAPTFDHKTNRISYTTVTPPILPAPIQAVNPTVNAGTDTTLDPSSQLQTSTLADVITDTFSPSHQIIAESISEVNDNTDIETTNPTQINMPDVPQITTRTAPTDQFQIIEEDDEHQRIYLDLTDEEESRSPPQNHFIHFIQDKVNAVMGNGVTI